ncbi:MAG: FkbM family methyltransferase [Aphanocapsa sp. GSE-SYN-MK-11-07L]|jgi:FkbM family methyltransferase|nr:FkbM family methyltransferase [Aphanocapsa sp. GSE-SYN-MK-11-07L]
MATNGETASKTFQLRQRLAALINAPNLTITYADVVITPNEINNKHGTGVLVSRIFQDRPNLISIRSRDNYQGEHDYGEIHFCLPHTGLSRLESYSSLLNKLSGSSINRVFCVPYFADDIVSAIVIKELFNVPLGAYIMDDQNIHSQAISDQLMGEFLHKCSLRFATHPELRDAYENKYGLKFWLLPAVVPAKLICSTPQAAIGSKFESRTGVFIGSIWSQKWFDLLRETIKGSNHQIDWYGNCNSPWFSVPKELDQDGIKALGLLPEEQLVEQLKTYPYVVVPSGTLDEREESWATGQLSLPGRILFALATSNTPVIILGSEKTSAARFVNRFKIGLIADYTAASFRQAVEQICLPENQAEMRRNAVAVAEAFSDQGITEWVWKSLELGEPIDTRFEKLLRRTESDLVHFIEPPVPSEINKDFATVYQVMRRLWGNGFRPDFVVDVGSSIGIWSYTVSKFFPDARFVLIDPLLSKYDQTARNYFIGNIQKVEVLEIAVSNQAGNVSFQVSPDLWGSSLLQPADFRTYESVDVKVQTLDYVAQTKAISGRGILKIDVQCAEHLVLEGAQKFLEQVDVIVAELSLVRYDSQAKVLSEMMQIIEQLGFRYYDDIGCWRSPADGTLLQKDILFLRNELFIPQVAEANHLKP